MRRSLLKRGKAQRQSRLDIVVERLVTPPPPCVITVEVKQELGNLATVWVSQGHRVPNHLVRAPPRLGVVINMVEQSQLLGEQRSDLCELFLGVDTSVEPREIAAGNREFSK